MEYTPEMLDALGRLVSVLENLGIPGLLALLLVVPTLTVIAFFALDFLRQRHIRKDDEERRKESKADRDLIRELVEQHRSDMEKVLRDHGNKHAEVSQFYRDNVELVKATQRMAIDMRDIIVNNTRAVEHLAHIAQNNLFCPIARKQSTGKE